MSKIKKIILILTPLAVLYLFCLPAKLFRQPLSATLSTADGTLMGARISANGQWCFEPASSVPDKFAKCIVTYEDKRFWWHAGIDFLSIGRAIRQNLSRREVVSGASTITMQVIRLSRPDAPRSIPEKLLEAVLASRLELRCSKNEILRLYASNAPFGGNVVGIDAAAWRYFGRSAGELSWAESAMLAVLPNSPALIHPGRNRERLLEKRNYLLDKLMEKGIIDDIECELAKDEPLPDKPLPMPDKAYHLLERLRAGGGDKAYTCTLDPVLQDRVNAIARSHFEDYHNNLVDNMGILVMSVATGDVLAYYGNTKGLAPGLRGADVDMIPAARSSGSTLKPLLYAAMLDAGEILPTTLIKDTPYNYNNFQPHNFARTFDGAVPADQVIQRSLNVPSVRMLEQYGVPRFLELLQEMGFDTITRDADHYGLSLILGGAEISLENLVRAYCSMAAKLAGDETGFIPGLTGHTEVPLSRGAIWLTFDALSKAGRPEEESSWQGFSSGRRIAWKTGTSWGNRDAWSVGVNRDYVVGVWVGNSDGEGRAQMTGVSYASPVMFDVFGALPWSGWFDKPLDSLVPLEVCSKSGLPASGICPETETVWVPDIETRPDECKYHRTVHLDADRRWLVNSSCYPVESMVEAVWFVLPPAQEWYYMKNHLDYRPLPPKHPDYDAASDQRNPIDIIYPQNGVTIVTTRSLSGREQGVVVRAAHTDPTAVLYWHLDDEFVGQTRDGEHDLLLYPEPGMHLLTALDANGFSRAVTFIAK
ncbi:MAG: penicillin-binding protein 1C [Bacteroidales bacterium]|nr:penicillin-binding protein 1C [Bacteroidales bacterium]